MLIFSRAKLYYTVSGIITPIGGRPVHRFREDSDDENLSYLNINQLDALNFIMSLFHASTCFEHTCSSSGGQNCTIINSL